MNKISGNARDLGKGKNDLKALVELSNLADCITGLRGNSKQSTREIGREIAGIVLDVVDKLKEHGGEFGMERDINVQISSSKDVHTVLSNGRADLRICADLLQAVDESRAELLVGGVAENEIDAIDEVILDEGVDGNGRIAESHDGRTREIEDLLIVEIDHVLHKRKMAVGSDNHISAGRQSSDTKENKSEWQLDGVIGFILNHDLTDTGHEFIGGKEDAAITVLHQMSKENTQLFFDLLILLVGNEQRNKSLQSIDVLEGRNQQSREIRVEDGNEEQENLLVVLPFIDKSQIVRSKRLGIEQILAMIRFRKRVQ